MEETSYGSNDLNTDERVLLGFVRVAEIFKRGQSAILRNYGLSFPQYNILRVLQASENGQNRISKVSQIMLVPSANMTGIAKRLEKNGFIIRKSDPKDERVTILEITPKSRRLLVSIEEENNRFFEVIMAGFTKEDKSGLIKSIRSLISNAL